MVIEVSPLQVKIATQRALEGEYVHPRDFTDPSAFPYVTGRECECGESWLDSEAECACERFYRMFNVERR